MSSSKVKTVRLHFDTWSRLKKHQEEDESFDALINKILDIYDEYKGINTKQTHKIIKELEALQNDLADAVNGLRKTYDEQLEWNREFGIKTFADALKFPWAKAQIAQTRRLKSEPEISKLRLKWIKEILNILWMIERSTKIVEEKKEKSLQEEIFGEG